jgi:hypothetical protein
MLQKAISSDTAGKKHAGEKHGGQKQAEKAPNYATWGCIEARMHAQWHHQAWLPVKGRVAKQLQGTTVRAVLQQIKLARSQYPPFITTGSLAADAVSMTGGASKTDLSKKRHRGSAQMLQSRTHFHKHTCMHTHAMLQTSTLPAAS